MKFTIRDLLLVTVIVALAIGWWVDRSRLADLAREAESFRTLSESLTIQLRQKNLGSNIQIMVDGDIVRLRSLPNRSVPASNAPDN